MTTVEITIDSEDDSLVGPDARGEMLRLLQNAVSRIRDGETSGRLIDINGNRAGDFFVNLTEEADEEDEDYHDDDIDEDKQ